MTTTNERQKQIKRLRELAQISKHKYLESGGDPHLSVGSFNNNDCLNESEKQELSVILNQLVKKEEITQYFQENGTWREKYNLKVNK
jgi:hypothetical protein